MRNVVWNILGAALVLVAIERQLGLLDFLTAWLRARAQVDGAYASRGVRQVETVRTLTVAAAACSAVVAALASRAGCHGAAQAITVTIMVTYLLVKAVSLHAVDQVLFRRVGGVALGNWIEIGLVCLAAAIATLAFSRSPVDRRRRPWT